MVTDREPGVVEIRLLSWTVNWSAVWIGALTAMAVGLVIGLIGYAIGAHDLATARSVDFTRMQVLGLTFSIGGAFFAFVVAGWAAGKMCSDERAEVSIMHGVFAWLVAVPLLLVLAALGAGLGFGNWYAGLTGVPAWSAAAVPVDPTIAAAFRTTSLATVGALLLGLVGAVIGGWMACGEPMTLTYYRRRPMSARERMRRAA